MISCPAPNGIRCVKPSSATLSPSWTSSATASPSGTISAIHPASCPCSCPTRRLPAEMHEDPAEVLGVLLYPVVERLDLLLVEEPQHVLFQLTGALARDDLDQRRLLPYRLVDDGAQGPVDVTPAVVDVVQIQLELHCASEASMNRREAAEPGASRSRCPAP